MIKRIITVAAVLIAVPAAAVADNRSNDRILTGDKGEFIEVFKRDDSGGDKNYAYTITEFTDKHGRACTVVSGDSEKTLGLDCDWKPKG